MALNFPDSPVAGTVFGAWRYDGTKWGAVSGVSGGGSAGDITAVLAGAGLSGGGTEGDVTIALSVPVTVARGGTGATDAATARTNLGAAPNPVNLASQVTGTLPVASGGTGATTGAIGPYLPLVAGSGNLLTGELYISTGAGQAGLHLRRSAGVSAGIFGETGAAQRWAILPGDSSGESGSNAGSNFAIYRYNDAGTFVDTPFSITRSTGVASFGNSVRLSGNYLTFANATPAGINTTSDGPFVYADQNYMIFHQGTSSLGWRFQANNGGNVAIINGTTGQFDISGLINCPQINVQQGAATVFMQLINSAASWNVQVEPTIGEWELRNNAAGAVRLAVRLDGTCFNTTGTWTAISDISTKRDIEPYTRGLAELVQLEPVMYKYNGRGGTVDDGRQMYGLVAQQVQPIVPEIISPTLAGGEELLGVDSGRLTFAMLNALREIEARLRALEDK